jgi:hypothetical protein
MIVTKKLFGNINTAKKNRLTKLKRFINFYVIPIVFTI